MEDTTKIDEGTTKVVPPIASEKRSKSAKRKKPKKKAGSQRRQARTYPGRTLEDCFKIIEAIKTQNAGNPWPPDEIAKAIKIKTRSSNFAEIIRSASLYGLVDGTYRAATVSMTELGRRLAYPENDQELKQAKTEAVSAVDLFRKVIQHYKGGNIPEPPFVNNTLTREFGLSSDFHDEFLRTLRKNIEFIGSEGAWPQQSLETAPEKKTKGSHPPLSKDTLRAFVIMPFLEREKDARSEGFFREVYTSIIKPACEKAGFEAATADRKGSDIIHTTILREILDADLVIADLTDHNPNVMFELGLRMAIARKPTQLIKTKDTGRIFDVDNVLRVFEYSQNLWQSTVQKDIPDLAEHISATWDARNTGSGYIEILTGKSGS